MTVFKAFEPQVKVNGETVLSIVDGLGLYKERAFHILESCGIKEPKPGEWYSQQAWLDAFKQISDNLGPATLYAIGKKIPENAVFPPEIDTVEKGLHAINEAYQFNHKDGEIGDYVFEKTGENQGKMVCRNPYPCDFDRGLIAAMGGKFTEKHKFKVAHDDSQPCRKQGADSCTYKVSW